MPPEPTPPVITRPIIPTGPPPESSNDRLISAAGEEYTSRGTSPRDNYEFVSTAARYRGIYYKVQFVALNRYNPGSSAFDAVRPYGTIETEYVTTKRVHRILLGSFFSEADAREALRKVHRSGYPSAYLVKYVDGQRFGRVNL